MSKTTSMMDMLRDLEAYGCGEVPSALELLRGPVLEKWEA